ncbi:helix-turn-helix domain-containing protein [Siminovitchia terrae]|uniref:Helix-turn-helix domain-containing protein n=1 Tax=Siminovitchia terrae TaxID=1914933 RepID=A0A429XAX3_SIMTE|nr:helix-turn-helix domain-containing protein [Siminovitchia terrae]RST60223.1 helix-turn-helix domain-containing protein [Siminovitchia terrae]
MKTRIDVIAQEESYTNLSTFKDVESLNEAVRTYRDIIKSSVKRADVQARLIDLLEILKRHSCKYVGVSFLCKNSIADKLEVSYKTVQRLMKKLEQLDMIRQVAMKRKSDMLQTANAIIIQPINEEVSDKAPVKSPTKCPTIKTSSNPLKQNLINKRNDVAVNDFMKDFSPFPGKSRDGRPATESLLTNEDNFKQAEFVGYWVPKHFASLVSYFYKDSLTIQEFWKVVKQCNRVVNVFTGDRAFNSDQELAIGVRAIKEFVMKVKTGVQMNNIFGYFNGIVNNLMDKLYFDRGFMAG